MNDSSPILTVTNLCSAMKEPQRGEAFVFLNVMGSNQSCAERVARVSAFPAQDLVTLILECVPYGIPTWLAPAVCTGFGLFGLPLLVFFFFDSRRSTRVGS